MVTVTVLVWSLVSCTFVRVIQPINKLKTGMPVFRYFLFFFRYFWPDPFSADPFSVFSISPISSFSFWTLSLFVFIFCETARTHRFSVIFAKVQWHPCKDDCFVNSVHIINWPVLHSVAELENKICESGRSPIALLSHENFVLESAHDVVRRL